MSDVIIAEGHKVLDGPLREIRRTHVGTRYRLELDSMTPRAGERLSGDDPILSRAVPVDYGWELDLSGPDAVRHVLAALTAIDAPRSTKI